MFDALSDTERHHDFTSRGQFLETRRVLDFNTVREDNPNRTDFHQLPETLPLHANAVSEVGLPKSDNPPLQESTSSRTLNPLISEFKPQSNHQSGTVYTQFSEFSKFLLKSVVRELSVSTEEEVDLLIKYLGPESSKQANNIKIANFSNP